MQRLLPTGTCRAYGDGAPGPRIVAPNHRTFDSRGNLFVSNSGVWKHDDGKLYRFAPGGETEVWSTELTTVPHGVALGPSKTHLPHR